MLRYTTNITSFLKRSVFECSCWWDRPCRFITPYWYFSKESEHKRSL